MLGPVSSLLSLTKQGWTGKVRIPTNTPGVSGVAFRQLVLTYQLMSEYKYGKSVFCECNLNVMVFVSLSRGISPDHYTLK